MLCIAHRLNTVVYYDQVLVMDKGSVKEYDRPVLLMKQSESLFAKMCQATGSFDTLYQIALSSQQHQQHLVTSSSSNQIP